MFPRETPDYRRIDQLTVRANYSFQLIHCYIVDRVHDAAYFLTKPNDSFTFFKTLFDCSEIERINSPLFAIIEIIGYKRRNEFLSISIFVVSRGTASVSADDDLFPLFTFHLWVIYS